MTSTQERKHVIAKTCWPVHPVRGVPHPLIKADSDINGKNKFSLVRWTLHCIRFRNLVWFWDVLYDCVVSVSNPDRLPAERCQNLVSEMFWRTPSLQIDQCPYSTGLKPGWHLGLIR